MYKLRRYIYLNRVPFCARQISYGRKSLVKLGVGQDIFKNTSEERPSDKSCSTSVFDLFPNKA